MQETKGHCKHGEFDLREGCPQCIAEREAEEGNTETSIAEAVEAVNSPKEGEIETETVLESETTLALRPGEDIEAHGFFEEAQKLLGYATALAITSDEIVKSATNDLSIISTLKKAMDDKRKTLLAPLKAQMDDIRETYNYLMAPVLEADKITRGKILAYRQEQERKRQEAEDIARMEREAAERKAALTGEPVVVPEAVEGPAAAPDRYHAEMGTLGKSLLHKWEVLDFALVPDQYKKIDAGAITNVVKASKGKIVIPGIKVWSEESLRVTTKKESE